ncbi:sulfatase-like hydrolase/transferase [Pontiella sulfatireligans]|uniref:Arylsulfatase n=1 Tax=Pontiella sulfatireligans TaxID=2750658 RepID=A0A6C2UFN8_9BACT|nr:sulfatase-like hydrolase/transferase [Pontiella sulfatireligans]VGO18739.1 Arylsulfatase [Pontiella sulfatireligans]
MRIWLILTALLLVRFSAQAAESRPPNIIFILADDLGYADLGCFGAKKIKTPVLDQMASEGMKFTSFYTHSICGPTRTSLLTGCYAARVAEYGEKKGHPSKII